MFKLSRRTLLLSSAALAAGAGMRGSAFAQSDQTTTLKLQGFGSDAELSAVTVDISMDPISNGWGDYVTRVISEFNAGSAADVYGTAIETFQAFSSRGL